MENWHGFRRLFDMKPLEQEPAVRSGTAREAEALRWLGALARPHGLWLKLAVLAGFIQALATIVFAAALAWLIHGLAVEGAAHGQMRAAWLAVPLGILLRAAMVFLREEAGMRLSHAVRDHLRACLLDRFHARGPAWQSRQAGGAVVSRLLEEVDALDGYFARYLPQRWLAVLVPLAIVVVVMPLNWVAGLILLATAPLIPLFMAIVGHGARARQQRQLEALARMSGQFLETLRGLTTLRLMDAHRRQAAVVERNADAFRARTMSVLRLAFLSGTVLEFFASLAIALSAVYLGFGLLGYLEVGFGGTPPTLFVALFILLLAPEFYLPLRELGTHYHARAEALAAARSLSEWLDDADGESTAAVAGDLPPPAGAPAIHIEGLGFAHREEVPVFDGFSLDIAAGESVALIGPSGSGKTTLLRLLLGQLAPHRGRILIDDTPLAALDPNAWRERIGWMSQHPRLMAATLADNLRVARRDASDADLIEALCFAGLEDWYFGLPQGLASRLGEGGQLMSGGQLRRLALARLSLRPASLLLLDEPTASLDAGTEALVVSRLATLRAGRTVVLLTHRSSPLKLADRIVRLDRPAGDAGLATRLELSHV